MLTDLIFELVGQTLKTFAHGGRGGKRQFWSSYFANAFKGKRWQCYAFGVYATFFLGHIPPGSLSGGATVLNLKRTSDLKVERHRFAGFFQLRQLLSRQ